MITIYKYPVQMSAEFQVVLPRGAEFLGVQVQNGEPQMWFRVDTSRDSVKQVFSVVGTGHLIAPELSCLPYKGTFQLADGELVFHLFGGIYA